MLKDKNHIHFIGIGGAGMSALAGLLAKDHIITGSDTEKSDYTRRLKKLGITIYFSHKVQHIKDSDLVVYSSAIDNENTELAAAKSQGVPVISRAELLAEVCQKTQYSIAVSGTHGKTGTTALLGWVLAEAGLNPVILAGGIMKNFNSNFLPGGNLVTITEADEYDRSFLTLHPDYSIITSLDEDHLECYGSRENLQENFIKFANQTQKHVVLCQDDSNIATISQGIKVNKTFYSTEKIADFYADAIQFQRGNTHFQVNNQHQLTIPLTGLHNVRNTLAVIAVANHFDISMEQIKSALEKFDGVERRFDILLKNEDHILIDDYAHHPKEIMATLTGIKKSWPDKKIMAVFQPHLFSRTQKYYREFAQALLLADKIFITEIYPAREKPIPGVSGKQIADEIKKLHDHPVFYMDDMSELPAKIMARKEAGDLIITMGAGNINIINEELINLLEK